MAMMRFFLDAWPSRASSRAESFTTFKGRPSKTSIHQRR
jgi:hypothetical protein